MRALKALVVVLTLLLLIGFGVLIWGIVRQANKLAVPPKEQTAVSTAGERTAWQRLLLAEPPGTRIAGVASAGDLVIIHLFTGTPGQEERLVVIDPGSGTMLGTVAITGEK